MEDTCSNNHNNDVIVTCVYTGRACGVSYTGDVLLVARAFRQQSVANLPREDRRALALVLRNLVDHFRRGHARLASANHLRPDRAGLVVAREDLADAAVGYLQDARDVTGTRAAVSQLDDALASVVGQWSAVDVLTSKLVDAAMS